MLKYSLKDIFDFILGIILYSFPSTIFLVLVLGAGITFVLMAFVITLINLIWIMILQEKRKKITYDNIKKYLIRIIGYSVSINETAAKEKDILNFLISNNYKNYSIVFCDNIDKYLVYFIRKNDAIKFKLSWANYD